ncbi:MAG: type I phosphomannose isomerase catalytic subunit [Cellulosilyticaceae bacterium]
MIKLKPALKDYLWGGNKLKNEYGKIGDTEIVAESWELSTHPDGVSTIEEGEDKGLSLSSYIKSKGKKELGSKCKVEDDIPILIKFIDAKDDLSIQVHPDDKYALKYEGDYGKTEMWYVLEAEENAELIYGFSKDMTKEGFRLAVENHTLTEVVNHVKVEKGDVFFIEPGMMHAIGKGIIIAEIQQRSNVTYRIYDFNRVGIDGKPRELHVDKALEVVRLNKAGEPKVKYTLIEHEGYKRGVLASCEYFHVELIEVNTEVELNVDETTFQSLLVVEGNGQIISEKEKIEMGKGDSVFLPAGYGNYSVVGECKLILSTV